MRVAVVGAGLGGLSAACHLVGLGHEVTILERDDSVGGRAGRWVAGGYQFDTGPTVLTMVDLIDEIFQAAGSTMADHVTMHRIDPTYRATFVDGSELRVRSDADAMYDEIRTVCGTTEADAFVRFSAWLKDLYELEMPTFIGRNYNSPLDLAKSPMALTELVRMGGFRRLDAKVGQFFADERLRRIFSFQALYAGLSPFKALALYGVITYLDTVGGVWFPDGGLHAVATGLADAAVAGGAKLRLSCPVQRIERSSSGAVTSIVIEGGERLAVDAVVANPDVPAVYRDLLGQAPPRRTQSGTYSPSCAVWLVGMRGRAPVGAAHHNIHFGTAWKSSFDELLGRGTMMRDPSLLVSMPSLGHPELAPDGGQGLYVLEPVPNLDGNVDWSRERDRLRERLMQRLAVAGYPIEVEVEQFTDPTDWAAMDLERGTPFSLAHTFRQTGPFRTANVDREIPGLVLTGSATVPGVGVPMVLLSGRLAAERVEQFAASSSRGPR